jgi:hypothetical protein
MIDRPAALIEPKLSDGIGRVVGDLVPLQLNFVAVAWETCISLTRPGDELTYALVVPGH